MSTLTSIAVPTSDRPRASSGSSRRWPLLRVAVVSWFAVAILGQLIFAAYVVALYGGAVAAGQMGQWNRVTPRAWIPGETLGNVVFGSHVLFTVVVVLGGLIQLLPPLRRRAPVLHRWNGRAYLLLAMVLSVGGLVMVIFMRPVQHLHGRGRTGELQWRGSRGRSMGSPCWETACFG